MRDELTRDLTKAFRKRKPQFSVKRSGKPKSVRHWNGYHRLRANFAMYCCSVYAINALQLFIMTMFTKLQQSTLLVLTNRHIRGRSQQVFSCLLLSLSRPYSLCVQCQPGDQLSLTFQAQWCQFGHPWGYPPKHRRTSLWDQAEPPCKISSRSVKSRLRNQ